MKDGSSSTWTTSSSYQVTKKIDDNIEKTQQILQWLANNNLYLKLEKYVSWKTKVEYLGLIIEENKLAMDPVKLSGITDWPTPNMLKQVGSFLGFGNYYWWFIQGYGNLTRPLLGQLWLHLVEI